MQEVSELRRREVETYFSVMARGASDRKLAARSFHNLGVYDADDFADLAATLEAAGGGGSFAFLGRDAPSQAGIVESLAAAGHEIVLHGHRHVACASLPDDLVQENVSRGLAAIEDAAGVTPTGFFAPLQEMNRATLEAVSAAGLDWAFGRTDAAVPADLALVEPERPYDLQLLSEGASPEEFRETMAEQADAGGDAFLIHPNMLDYFDAIPAFEAWAREFEPVPIGEAIEGGGIGLVVDAIRPLDIR